MNEFIDQQPFRGELIPDDPDDTKGNPEPRCPCVLLLDTSGSMGGEPIRELNAGLATFKEELSADTLAMKRVVVAIITFGPVNIATEFHTAMNFHPPVLDAGGDTPMGAAIKRGIALVRERKDFYKEKGIAYYRPWIFLITDGAPTDEWQSAAATVREGETAKSFAFFAVGVQNADMNILRQISVREPLKLKGLEFRKLFKWLSDSMGQVSHSVLGTSVPISPPQGWTEV